MVLGNDVNISSIMLPFIAIKMHFFQITFTDESQIDVGGGAEVVGGEAGRGDSEVGGGSAGGGGSDVGGGSAGGGDSEGGGGYSGWNSGSGAGRGEETTGCDSGVSGGGRGCGGRGRGGRGRGGRGRGGRSRGGRGHISRTYKNSKSSTPTPLFSMRPPSKLFIA